MPTHHTPRPTWKAQTRLSPTRLAGAPQGKALPGRTLLARRRLGTGSWCTEVNLWGDRLLEVRVYDVGGSTCRLVLPQTLLGELAAFTAIAVDAMKHELVVGALGVTAEAAIFELVPPRRFPDGTLLIAHGVADPAGGLPIGLSLGHYRMRGDGLTVQPVVVHGEAQVLGMHRAGTAALVSLFAEAVGAARPPAGSA